MPAAARHGSDGRGASSRPVAAARPVRVDGWHASPHAAAHLATRVLVHLRLASWYSCAGTHYQVHPSVAPNKYPELNGVGAVHPCIGSDPIANRTTDREGLLMCCIECKTMCPGLGHGQL